MERRRISCPETAKREVIELEPTPCGVVITGCSRFHASSELDCTRACAARQDRSERRAVDATAPRILIVYTSKHAQTKAVALALAHHFSRDGITAELADAETGSVPPFADYEAVVIGSAVQRGHHARSVLDLVAHNTEALAETPAFFFSVGSADGIERMRVASGWQPDGSAAFEAVNPDRRRFLHRIGGNTPSTTPPRFMESPRVRDFALLIGQDVPDAD